MEFKRLKHHPGECTQEKPLLSPAALMVLTSCSPSTGQQCSDGSSFVARWGSHGPGGVGPGPPGRHMFPWPSGCHSASCQTVGQTSSDKSSGFRIEHSGYTRVASYCWSLVSPAATQQCHAAQVCFDSQPWSDSWDPTDCSLQAPLSMGFPRQEYWSGLPFPTPGDLPDPGIEPASLAPLHWQTDSLPLRHQGSPCLLRSWPQTDLPRVGRFPASWMWGLFFFAQVNFDFYLFHSSDFGVDTHKFCRWQSGKNPLQLVIEWISSLI